MAEPARRTDLPTIEDDTRPFWDAAGEGRFLVKRCRACGAVHHYPRQFCPSCWSDDVAWVDASGRATLYTWSVVYANDLPPFPERLPYVAAVVDLEEGPRVMTNIVDCDPDSVRVGQAVELVFHDTGAGSALPRFRPAS